MDRPGPAGPEHGGNGPVHGSRARCVSWTSQRVRQGLAQVEVEGVAELKWFRPVAALTAPAAAIDSMLAECVAAKPGEQVVENLLADPSAAPRGQLKVIPVTGEIAGRLESSGEGVEDLEAAPRFVAHRLAQVGPVDPAQVRGRLHILELCLERLEPAERLELAQGTLKTELLLATEAEPLAEPAGQDLVERRRELGEVPAQPVVAQQAIDQRVQFRTLGGGQGLKQRLHRRVGKEC